MAAVVSDLCLRAGLQYAEQDCSRLNETLDGMVIDNQTSVRSILEILQQANFFDAVEKNEVIEFLPRAHRKTIAVADQDLLPSSKPNQGVSYIRTQEAELPRRVDINFIDTSKNYRISNQHATREHLHSEHTITMNLPLCMSEPTAQNIADVTLYNLWMERMRYNFTLPPKYAFIAPSDLLVIGDNPRQIIRVNEVIFGNNFALKIEGVGENPEIYNILSGSISSGYTESVEPLAETYIEILDLPALPGEDTLYQGHIYVAVAASNNNWQGATIFAAQEANAGYEKVAYLSQQATMGTILTALPRECLVAEQLIVNLVAGEILSAKDNLALVGDEVIGFTNARLVAPYQYEISNISRGKYGNLQLNHVAGERFVLISSELYRYQVPHSLIGQPRYIKAVTDGNTIGNSPARTFTYQANCLKPYSPADLKYEIQDDGDLHFSWQRRSRIHTSGISIPLGEEREEYCCELIGISGKIIFTAQVYVPLLVVPAMLLAEDKPVAFKVAQISAVVGKGFFAELKMQ